MSEVIDIWDEADEAVQEVIDRCKHEKKFLVKWEDHSCVGRGALYPAVIIMCVNCGTMKIIHGLNPQKRKRVQLRLTRQGWKDERINCYPQRRDFGRMEVQKRLDKLRGKSRVH